MPGVAKGIDNVPQSVGGITSLQYVEALLHDQRELFDARLRDSDLRYQQRFDAQTIAVNAALLAAKEAIGAALLAAEKGVAKAEAASDRRFEGVNEFRQSLNDIQTTLIPRAEADARFQATEDKLDVLRQRIDKSEGAGGGLQKGWTILLGAVTLISTLFAIYFLLAK